MTKTTAEVLRTTSRQDALNYLGLQFANFLMDNGYFTSCLNCHHWQHKEELCGLFKQRPPARIIVCGCEEHTDIPF